MGVTLSSNKLKCFNCKTEQELTKEHINYLKSVESEEINSDKYVVKINRINHCCSCNSFYDSKKTFHCCNVKRILLKKASHIVVFVE